MLCDIITITQFQKTIHRCEELWENIQHPRQHLVARGAQLEKSCVCVVMSCVWCAYSCSEVRRLLGQVQGFSPLPLCCHSWNNWLDYRHLSCFTPALHSKAAFSSTLACFFFTPLHWDVKEQKMQNSLAALMCANMMNITSKRTVHNCAKHDKCFLCLFSFLYVCFDFF